MVVKIEEIVEGGLTLNEPMPAKLLASALADSEGFRSDSGFKLTARLFRVSGGVLLEGAFAAPVIAPCKRCLADVRLDVPVDFTLNLVPESLVAKVAAPEDDGRSPSAGSFELGHANDEVFNGKSIDLDPILREQVLLALPLSVVCREDCRGLCSVCGQNLNEKECGCERKVPDPRLAALKDIKLS
jgi:uncharacterized protein